MTLMILFNMFKTKPFKDSSYHIKQLQYQNMFADKVRQKGSELCLFFEILIYPYFLRQRGDLIILGVLLSVILGILLSVILGILLSVILGILLSVS